MNTRLFVILSLLFCLASATYAQNVKAYKLMLQTATNDSVKAFALSQLSFELAEDNPKEALIYGFQGKEIAERINNKFLRQKVYDAIAQSHDYLKDYKTSYQYFQKALQVNKEIKDSSFLGSIFNNLAISFYFQGKLDSSLAYHIKALAIRKATGNKKALANTYNNIGLIYRVKKDYEKTISYYKQSLKLKEEIGDNKGVFNTLNNIGVLHKNKKEYDSAIIIFSKLYKTATALGAEPAALSSKLNIAMCLNSQGKYEEALVLLSELNNNPRTRSVADVYPLMQLSLGEAFVGVKQYGKALDKLTECLELKYPGDRYEALAEIHRLLYVAAENSNKYPIALAQYKLYKLYSDSMLNQTMAQNIDELNARYNFEQKEQEIALLNKNSELKDLQIKSQIQSLQLAKIQDLQRQQEIALLSKNSELKDLSLKEREQSLLLSQSQNKAAVQQLSLLQKDNQVKGLTIKDNQRIKLLFILGFIIVSLVAASVFLLFYNKQKAASLLEEKNAIISKSLADKEVLLKEIHHRVKNNLQIVSSLLNLQSRTISDATALAAIKEGRDRVKSMALLHQNLYQDDNLTGVDVKNYIELLTQSLFNSYNINKDAIALATNIQDIQLDVDTVIPIGLIVNELISNALKYAFAETEKGLIEINLLQSSNQLLLEVKDNGKGMPADWNYNNVSASLGYQLIKSFVQKMKGELFVQSQQGTHIKIIINKYKLIA